MNTTLRLLLPCLLLAAAAQAAEVRVQGNMTSDVLATGYGTDGAPVGERFTEHMGSTGWVPATPGGVSRGQDLGAHAPMANARLNLRGRAALGDLSVFGDAQVNANEPDGIGASASGGIHAEWFTGFVLRSDSLPDGTRVPLLFTYVVEGFGSLLADEGNDNFLLGQLSFSGFEGVPPGVGRLYCEDFVGACQRHVEFEVFGRIGQRSALRGQLDLGVRAGASASQDIFFNRAQVAAGNSSHLYLDIANPAVRYELDDSGLQFERAPVGNAMPAPPALAMVLLGMVQLGARRVRSPGASGGAAARRVGASRC